MSFIIGSLYFVIIFLSIVLILLIILQSNKGSDLGLIGGSSEMVFGGKTDGLSKITSFIAFVIFFATILVSYVEVRKSTKPTAEIEQIIAPVKTLDQIKKEEKPKK